MPSARFSQVLSLIFPIAECPIRREGIPSPH